MDPITQRATQPSISDNVQSLMTGKVGQSRQKAIITLATRRNITRNDARFHQAVRISQAQARKQNG